MSLQPPQTLVAFSVQRGQAMLGSTFSVDLVAIVVAIEGLVDVEW
jgi:hypothetical protein